MASIVRFVLVDGRIRCCHAEWYGDHRPPAGCEEVVMLTFDVPPEVACPEQRRYARAMSGGGVLTGVPVLDLDPGTLRMLLERARRAG
jgi:hypothetical protein